MSGAEIAAIITAAMGILISLSTAILSFRGGMPAAADDVASAFQKLHEELNKKIASLTEELNRARAENLKSFDTIAKLREDLTKETDLRQKQYEQIQAERATKAKAEEYWQKQLQSQQRQINDLTEGIKVLIAQLRENGIHPRWTLPDE